MANTTFEPTSQNAPDRPSTSIPWYKLLTGYHWLVLLVCTAAWSFDCLNQQFFNLARKPALADLHGSSTEDAEVTKDSGYATSALLVGWATGGIFFGVMADRAGRVKTLFVMILAYSLFTGLCGLTQSPWQYIAATFVTGMGCGGIFPIACTLVAESLPGLARSSALGFLQAFSAVGNVGAGFLWLAVLELRSRGLIQNDWRWLFGVGIIPALLAIIVIRRVREPDSWLRAHASAQAGLSKAGSITELFGDPRWRRRAIVGMLLGASGVIGLWGIGVFSNDLTQSFIGKAFDDAHRAMGDDKADLQFVLQTIASPAALEQAAGRIQPRDLLGANSKDNNARALFEAAVTLHKEKTPVSPQAVQSELDRKNDKASNVTNEKMSEERAARAAILDRGFDPATALPVEEQIARIRNRQTERALSARRWAGVTLIMFNFGAFFGIYAFAWCTQWIGRRPTFAISFIAAGVTTATAFACMSKTSDIYWMTPLMGAAQLSLFGGYAIYFPELFPTRLRSTGSSFCYNVARYVAAAAPVGLVYLRTQVFAGTAEPFRNAGVTMCACFLVGLVTLIFAPETKGQPLPE
jgi:MFS family permease